MARWISVVKQTEEQNTHTHRDTHYTVFPRLPHFCQSLWKRFSAGSSYMQQPMTMATQTHDMRVIPVHSRWSISHWNCQRIDSTIIERLPLTQDAMWSRLSSLWIHFCTKGVVFHIMLRRIHAAHQPYPQSCIWFVAFQTINYAWTLMTSQFFFVSSLFLVVVSFFSFTHFDDRFDFCRLSVCWHFPWVVVAVVKLQQHLWYVRKPIEAKVSAWNYHGTPFMRHATYQNLFCQQFLWKLIYAAQIIPTYRFSQYRSRRHSSNERANG